jgi:hypothetical protein
MGAGNASASLESRISTDLKLSGRAKNALKLAESHRSERLANGGPSRVPVRSAP